MRGRLPLCVVVVLLGACSASSAVTVGPPADVTATAGEPSTSTAETTGARPVAPVDVGGVRALGRLRRHGLGVRHRRGAPRLRRSVRAHHHHRARRGRRPRTTSTRIGSLFVNPGGPGGSGIETVHYLVDELPENVKARFDIVGFDPRGVGASTAVDCVDDEAKDEEADLDPTPDTPAEISAAGRPLGRSPSQACAEAQGDLLPYLGTVNAARDLDRLREAVGDDGLTYLGFSYGTTLGRHLRRPVPGQGPGARPRRGHWIRPTGVDSGGRAAERALRRPGLRRQPSTASPRPARRPTVCAAQPDAEALLDRVRADVESAPVPAPTVEAEDGRQLTTGLLEIGVASALYDTASWPFLAVALKDAAAGDGSAMIRLADNLNRRATGRDLGQPSRRAPGGQLRRLPRPPDRRRHRGCATPP